MIPSEPSNALAVTFSKSRVVLCFAVPIVCILRYAAVPRNQHGKSALALQSGTACLCLFTSKQGPWKLSGMSTTTAKQKTYFLNCLM